MKIMLLCALLGTLLLSAREYRVVLPAMPGPEQVCFLDLAPLKADSATFKLVTPQGKEVPFSFDMRLKSPDFKGRKQANGYHTWSTAPAAENRFFQPGWLSFKSVPGVQKYIFTFRDGAQVTLPRPDPAARAWWIELSKAPQFKDLKMLYFKKGDLKVLPQGGCRITGLLRFRSRGFDLDPRGTGRRILGLMRLRGTGKHHFSVQYRSDLYRQAAALNINFKLPSNELTDVCAEGMICRDKAQTIRSKGYPVWISPGKNTSAELHDFHVQLPPAVGTLKILLPSTLLNTGDEITPRAAGLAGENILPLPDGPVKGFQIGAVTGKLTLDCRLLSSDGKLLFKGKNKLSFKNISPGSYKAEITLLADGKPLTAQTFSLTVQKGPF